MHEKLRRRWWQVFRPDRCSCGREGACPLNGTPFDGEPVPDSTATGRATVGAYQPRHGQGHRRPSNAATASAASRSRTLDDPLVMGTAVLPVAPLLTARWTGQTGLDRRRAQAPSRYPRP